MWQHNDVWFVDAFLFCKKYGEPMILRWSHTNLGLLYTMVTSEWSENEVNINSLTAIDAHECQHFNKFRGTVVSHRIFIRSQSLIAR